jgi:hypothetical protein
MEGLVKIIDTPGVEVECIGQKKSIIILGQDIFKQTITAVH